MSKRTSVGWIYFAVIIMTLLLRVSSSLDIYSALGIENADAFFTCIVQIIIFGALSIFLYTVTARSRGEGVKEITRDFGVKKVSAKNIFRVVIIGICMIVVSSAISYLWQLWLIMIGFTHIPSFIDYSSLGVLFTELILTALLPGIFEEIAHRGLLYAGYKETGVRFVFISALLFSLMHQNIVQTGYTFFAGAVMALAMYYTGSIWCGIFMHILNNGWAVVSGYINQNGGVFDFVNKIQDWFFQDIPHLMIAGVIALVLAVVMIFTFYRMRKDAVKDGIISGIKFEKPVLKKQSALENLPLIMTIIVGVVATLFSFVWGMTR